MPKVNFKTIPDLKPRFEFSFKTIPDAWYLAEIISVKPDFQPSGVERWTVIWGIVAGEQKGTAVKDWLHWGDEDDGPRSEQALARCKVLCKAIGINVDVEGSLDIQPQNVIGGIAHIKTRKSADKKDPTKIYVNVEHEGFKAASDSEILSIHAEDAQVAQGLSQGRLPGDEIPF